MPTATVTLVAVATRGALSARKRPPPLPTASSGAAADEWRRKYEEERVRTAKWRSRTETLQERCDALERRLRAAEEKLREASGGLDSGVCRLEVDGRDGEMGFAEGVGRVVTEGCGLSSSFAATTMLEHKPSAPSPRPHLSVVASATCIRTAVTDDNEEEGYGSRTVSTSTAIDPSPDTVESWDFYEQPPSGAALKDKKKRKGNILDKDFCSEDVSDTDVLAKTLHCTLDAMDLTLTEGQCRDAARRAMDEVSSGDNHESLLDVAISIAFSIAVDDWRTDDGGGAAAKPEEHLEDMIPPFPSAPPNDDHPSMEGKENSAGLDDFWCASPTSTGSREVAGGANGPILDVAIPTVPLDDHHPEAPKPSALSKKDTPSQFDPLIDVAEHNKSDHLFGNLDRGLHASSFPRSTVDHGRIRKQKGAQHRDHNNKKYPAAETITDGERRRAREMRLCHNHPAWFQRYGQLCSHIWGGGSFSNIGNRGTKLLSWTRGQRDRYRALVRVQAGGGVGGAGERGAPSSSALSLAALMSDDMKAALDEIGFGDYVLSVPDRAADAATKRAAKSEANWEEKYQQLKRYHEKHGHCMVTASDKLPKLAGFVSAQRFQYRKWKKGETTTLTDEQRGRLDELGFVWDMASRAAEEAEAKWRTMLEALKAYKDENGHLRVEDDEHKALASWVRGQRTLYRRWKAGEEQPSFGKSGQSNSALTESRRLALEELGAEAEWEHVWSDNQVAAQERQRAEAQERWEKMLEQLKDFKERNGHFDAPPKSKLQKWVSCQRSAYRQYQRAKEGSSMTEERKLALDAIAFPWEAPESAQKVNYDAVWLKRFESVKNYKLAHGHFDIPRRRSKENEAIYSWMNWQRKEYKKWEKGEKSSLSDERRKKLAEIGFDFNKVSRQEEEAQRVWVERFEELRTFQARHGHLNVPETEALLHQWLHQQHQDYSRWRRGEKVPLSDDRREKLLGLGYDVAAPTTLELNIERKWNDRFEELEEFWCVHGNMNVPKDGSLAKWLGSNRKEYRKWERGERSSMTAERRAKLAQLGFEDHVRSKVGYGYAS